MGIKGSWRRPRGTTREEEDLRALFFEGKISRKTFDRRYAELKRKGLIQRSGRVLK